jgi:hypothetical protein
MGAAVVACNVLLGNTAGRCDIDCDASVLDSGLPADALEPKDASSDASDPIALDAAEAGDSPDSDANTCGHSCLGGDCISGACQPVRLGYGYARPMNVVADPGTTGSVFFGIFDTGQVYRFDKRTGQISLPYPTTNAVTPQVGFVVTNANNVYWTIPNGERIAWATRSGSSAGQLHDVAYSMPWGMGIDTGFVYWCDRWMVVGGTIDCWRIDLTLTTPKRIYSEILQDGGPGTDALWGVIAVDPGADGYVFFTALNQLNRMKKDGTELVAFAKVIGQSDVGINGGFVYWQRGDGALLRAPEQGIPACDSGSCAEIVVPAGAPSAFDDKFVYWGDGQGAISRARKDGTSAAPEVLARHPLLSRLAVDDVAVYYMTQPDQNNAGAFWRVAK